jgi:hypothetical protein
MKFFSLSPSPLRPFRHVLPLALGLLSGAACSDEEAAPAPQPSFGIAVASIDGNAPDGEVPLACTGLLAVTVSITTTIDTIPFLLRPANACGASKRCGYVRVEALDSEGDALTHVDSATSTGLLELDASQRSAIAKLRVSLISGVDQTVIVNKDLTEVTALAEPTFALATDCDEPMGGGGAGGQSGSAGASGEGGNGGSGAGTGGAPEAGAGGAAAGASSDVGGAPGDQGGAGGTP